MTLLSRKSSIVTVFLSQSWLVFTRESILLLLQTNPKNCSRRANSRVKFSRNCLGAHSLFRKMKHQQWFPALFQAKHRAILPSISVAKARLKFRGWIPAKIHLQLCPPPLKQLWRLKYQHLRTTRHSLKSPLVFHPSFLVRHHLLLRHRVNSQVRYHLLLLNRVLFRATTVR